MSENEPKNVVLSTPQMVPKAGKNTQQTILIYFFNYMALNSRLHAVVHKRLTGLNYSFKASKLVCPLLAVIKCDLFTLHKIFM